MTPASTSLATPGTVSSECRPRSSLSSKTPTLGRYVDGVPTPIWIVEPWGTRAFTLSAIAMVSAEGTSIPSCALSLSRVDRLEVRRAAAGEPIWVDLVDYLLDGGTSILRKCWRRFREGLHGSAATAATSTILSISSAGMKHVAKGAYESGVDLNGDLSRALGETALVPRLGPKGDLSVAVGCGGDGQHHVHGLGLIRPLVVGLEGLARKGSGEYGARPSFSCGLPSGPMKFSISTLQPASMNGPRSN